MISSALFYSYIFLQSAGIEALFLRFALRKSDKANFWIKVFWINALTHPIVVYLILADGWLMNLEGVLIAEVFAIGAETFLLKAAFNPLSLTKAFCYSLAANLLSWQIAPLLTWTFVQLFL
jgi:hypothetical protein